MNIKTKVQIYKATVLSVVLYGAESWTCSDKDYARLNVFNTKRLRSIVGMSRLEISNERLYKMTGMCPLENMVRKYRLRWLGHVRRMDDSRIPKRVLFGEVVGGKQGPGRPKANWMNCVEKDCQKCNIPSGQWQALSKDRTKWLGLISYLTPERFSVFS